MIIYKGIKQIMDFRIIIDFLFEKYNINELDCDVVIDDKGPMFLYNTIHLKVGSDVCQLNYQFTHELTHAIQFYQNRGINEGTYPAFHDNETEAVANALWVMGKVFGSNCYLEKVKLETTDDAYYDYTKAFKWIETNMLKNIWEKNKSI